ncbi:MAG TPA: hypothetical protein VGI45_10250 [Terracidiphilus sp.]|jgi:hypothetical protein
MRITAAGVGFILSGVLVIQVHGDRAFGQNQSPPLNHVIIPNPTPRPPDLKDQYDTNSKDQNTQKELSVRNQLRAREIWLQSNQLLLLAQQLDEEANSAARTSSMAAKAAKVGKIQKLAQSIQDKLKSD